MTIAANNAGYVSNVYFPEGGKHMRVRTNDGVAATANTGLIGSEDQLWGDCPVVSNTLVPSLAVVYDEPFVTFDTTNDWTATQATAGSAAISTTVPGALKLDAGASTAHEGEQVQRLKAAFVPAANKSIWFECTVEAGTALTIETFIGLAESNTTLISGGALNTINNIGWSSVTGDGVLLFGAGKASVQSTGIAAVTLSTTVPHRLGFFYDGVADTVQQYIDGVATGAPIATTNIPKVVVYPSLVCQSTGTSEPTLTVSGLRVVQLR